MNPAIRELAGNVCVWAPLCAWLTAQSAKMLCGFARTHRMDFGYLVSTGGMPSAHAAMSWALATSVGLAAGFGSPVFAASLALASITVFDASTVRRAAGQQARLLNDMVDELFRDHHFSQRKLAELLGHTRLEVFMGMAIGILVGILTVSLWPQSIP